MMQLVKYVSDTLDMNKRLKSAQDYMLVVERLISDDYGKHFTLEDFRYICERMLEAKYFERCKFPEFLDAWRKHDDRKTQHAHVRNEQGRAQREAEASARVAEMWRSRQRMEESVQREPVRPDRVEWMNGASRLTPAEREKLQQNDRARRNTPKP